MASLRIPASAFLAASASLALAACSEPAEDAASEEAAAAVEAPPIIEERQANLEEMGDVFKPIADTLKTDAPDTAMIQTNAGILYANLQKLPDHFPAGTGMDDGYDTDALASIWERPEEFSAAAQASIEAGQGLVDAAASEDIAAIQAAVGTLGKTCGDCHDNFRADDE